MAGSGIRCQAACLKRSSWCNQLLTRFQLALFWSARLHHVPGSRMSACGTGSVGDRPDVGEHAAGVPRREGFDQRRGAVELDASLAGGLGPGELAGVPLDERFGVRRDVEVLVETGVRLADFGVAELDDQPITLPARAAGEVEA